MSKVAQRFALSQARAWAREAHEGVSRHSALVTVAGSIRRQREDVGDIDLVVLDISDENPWFRHAITQELAGLGYEQHKDGERIASFTRDGACGLDLYYATIASWGITLLVRTGSAAHNVKLTQVAQRMLPARSLKVSQGVVDTGGRVIASQTEEEIFAALGVPFVAPEDREAPEYQSWIREDVS